jgi:endonuclease I
MNRFIAITFVLLFTITGASGQQVYLSPAQMQFDTLLANQKDSLVFYVVNHSTQPVSITDINASKPVFWVRDTAFVVAAGDSVATRLYFQTNQNVTWTDVLSIENSGARGVLPLRVRGTAKYPEALYAPTQGLWENNLKTVLLSLITNHTVLGYNTARDRMFETIDDPLGNDTLECIYTGRRIHAATRTEGQNQGFNTEHSWPQSTFSSADPMVSDINHLFPVDEPANSARSNYPFGPVVSGITWQSGGSKLGRNAANTIVFEPRDSHKGDVARVMFYFLLRYPTNYGTFMDATQEAALRLWYKADPVSTKEILRCNAIAVYQGKRNPLIDHPEFVDRISYFRSSTVPAQQPNIVVSQSTINFGEAVAGDTIQWQLLIRNSGLSTLSVLNIGLQSATPNFQIGSFVNAVPADSFQQVMIRFTPTTPGQTYSNTIVVQSNDPGEGIINIPIVGTSTTTSVSNNSTPAGFTLSQNYPDPFNPTTTIEFVLPSQSQTRLFIYDLLGREIATLIDGVMPAGDHSVVWNASGIASGVYLYTLTSGEHSITRKLVLIR